MIVDTLSEIEKHGSAKQALAFALIRESNYIWKIKWLSEALRAQGIDPDKILKDMDLPHD